MFQNISKNNKQVFDEDVKIEGKELSKYEFIKETFKFQNCIIYILSFMLSMAGGTSKIFTITPFAFAIIAASVGAEIPTLMVFISCLIGTIIKFGISSVPTFILTLLVFLVTIIIKRPAIPENSFEVNEKKKVGIHIAVSVLIIQLLSMLFSKAFYLYDFLYSIILTMSTYVIYKIFVNSLIVFKEFRKKKVYAIEEVLGASVLAIIAINAIGNFNIFGFSIRNILNILVVLVLGWKNGMAIGATGGITIGLTLGIIQNENPVYIAAYAISGFIAGILSKLGRIGVIAGFIVGNIILAYISNGNTVQVIRLQEILVAALGLLAMPKNAGIKVSDLSDNYKLLPEITSRTLEENKETVSKLNNMSNTISQIAKEYGKSDVAVLTDEEEIKQKELNKTAFENELKTNLEGQEENLLYDEIYYNNEGITDEIFDVLTQNGVITRKDVITLFANHNNYIMGYGEERDENNYLVKEDLDDMLKCINSAYRVSKINFVWSKKIKQNKKNVSEQLESVSEAISNLAEQITIKEEDKFIKQKEEIKALLNEKEILVKEISIKQEESGKYEVTIYTNVCDSLDGKQCYLKKISKIIEKVLEQKVTLQKQICGLRENENSCMFSYTSQDKFSMQVGISKSKKAGSVISGDTTIQTRLEDGKYLLAISDGMGSGAEARKSSKIAIKMLERLLETGFNKDIALKLINSIISNNSENDMYATLDVNILDLYKGEMEFFKNGACPTFLKRNGKVEILKSIALPAGILESIDLIEYNHELKNGDIILMCSDGIIESNKSLVNKELWVKDLLEELETDDSQRIADIVLNEARDNSYGKEKDDMTVICCRIYKK